MDESSRGEASKWTLSKDYFGKLLFMRSIWTWYDCCNNRSSFVTEWVFCLPTMVCAAVGVIAQWENTFECILHICFWIPLEVDSGKQSAHCFPSKQKEKCSICPKLEFCHRGLWVFDYLSFPQYQGWCGMGKLDGNYRHYKRAALLYSQLPKLSYIVHIHSLMHR